MHYLPPPLVEVVFAQDLPVYDFQSEPSQIHPDAVFGSTPERIAAWESLTPEEQQQAIDELNVIIANSTNPPATDPGGQVTANVPLGFVDTFGIEFTVPSEQEVINGDIPLDNQLIVFDQFSSTAGTTEQSIGTEQLECDYCDPIEDPPPSGTPTPEPLPSPTPTPTPNPTSTPNPTPTPTPSADEGLDGLSDSFESALADGFTPYYRVSTGEKAGTGFATFNDSVPETVAQSFPAVPPISHYRVTPLRFVTGLDGVQYGLIQLDYLTLWNRDDGLQINALCSTGLSVGAGLAGYTADELLSGSFSHELDNERSIILAAAPVTAPNTFNANASAYKALKFFTAAHEGTPFDHSLVFTPDKAISIGNHIELWISRSKHASYPFSPNNFPLTPRHVIETAFNVLDDLFFYGQIGYLRYLASLYLLDFVFFRVWLSIFRNREVYLQRIE